VLRPRAALTCAAAIAILVLTLFATPAVSAQTQYIEASPGYVNLGLTTSILASAPSAGSYSVIVTQPNGTSATLSFDPTASGQMFNATYGNATLGFKTLIDQVGTYNVFLEQGSQVVSATSFYATNKLQVVMEMVTGGTCDYVSGVPRGAKMFPHLAITYASDGAPWTDTVKGWSVKVLTPNGVVTPATWDPYAKAFEVGVLPNWNYTFVGPWNPKVNASDAAGNRLEYVYAGSPFTISPAELNTSIEVVNATSGVPTSSLLNGQEVTIKATISYPTNAEPVVGFVGPLSPARGGFVSAQVGWGFYNTTSGTFGGKNPGGLLGTVPMTYSGSNGTWSGQFVSGSLPKLQPGSSYEVVVSSKDGASPSNEGFGMASLSPGTVAVTVLPTTTTVTSTQTVQTIPDSVYAALAILLTIGVLVGYIVRIPKIAQ
jgi:hypothetical protein